MKKIILSLAVVFVMLSFTTVGTSVEKINITESMTEEVLIGRDYVDSAMGFVNAAISAGIGDGNLNGDDHDQYMNIYHFYYKECMLGFI